MGGWRKAGMDGYREGGLDRERDRTMNGCRNGRRERRIGG